MGCDGGSIPKRDELTKLKEKPPKADPTEVNRIHWTSCALSKETLNPPIVACQLGNLYNKEAILKALIAKNMPAALNHIKSMKDVFEVHFKENPRFQQMKERKNEAVMDLGEEAPFICPITSEEVGGGHKFSVIRTCGCVFSDSALKECPSDVCLQCNKPFTVDNILQLNPEQEEQSRLRQQLNEKRKISIQEKKKKKDKSSKVIFDTQAIEQDKERAKRKLSEKEEIIHKKKKSNNPMNDKSTSLVSPPPNANKEIYASIFTSSLKGTAVKENFLCRNVSRS